METKEIKLSKKKNGNGYITSYSVNLGCAEARECGFLDSHGEPVAIEKIIDPQQHRIILQAKVGE